MIRLPTIPTPPLLTLTTDFGADGPYVAAMKGVVLGTVPTAQIVDVSHTIAPQNVRQGGFVLACAFETFPPGTVHLAVVDPGVGTSRPLVALLFEDQWFLGPDNGLLLQAFGDREPVAAWSIESPAIRRRNVSSTFHGRDILAPAAAHLLAGNDPDNLGPRRDVGNLVRLPELPLRVDPDGTIQGSVVFVDRFGNALTNVRADRLRDRDWIVEIADLSIEGLARTYGDHPPGRLVALVGSSGWLEVAEVQGNAARKLGIAEGDRVTVHPRNSPVTPDPERLETLRALDKAHVWHPFTAVVDWEASDPLVIERGDGASLFDTDGKRYLDGVSSLWCNVHGHRHPEIDAAIRDQLDRLAHSTLLGVTHPSAIELAAELARRAPAGLTRVFFSDDGATAVEAGLKIAFQHFRQKPDPEPDRSLFLALDNAYHGDTLGDVSVGGVARFHAMFAPLLFSVLRAPTPHCYRCPLGLRRPECAMRCLDDVERLLEENPGRVAAVVIEPLVQCAAGMITHPDGYLRGLREITRRHGVLLIADEVAVGFGRTGTLWACQAEGVVPDILCLAKGLTGGYLPLAATLTTEEIYRSFRGTAAEGKTFYHGHTYGGNPLGAAAALANLRVFDRERTLETLPAKVERLRTRLAEMASLPHVGNVRQRGLIAGIELVADVETRRPFAVTEQVGARICRRARDFGVLTRPLGDVLVVMPPLSVTVEQIDELMNVLTVCTREVIAACVPAC